MKNFKGTDSHHHWTTNSICRHLLYEGCDLRNRLGNLSRVYGGHAAKREHKNFFDPSHRQRAVEIFFEFYDYLSEDLTVFPAFGTLLGICRDDDFIPHDDDIDIGFFKKDSQKLIEKLDDLHGKNGYLVIRNEFSSLYSLAKEGIMIDLYEFESLEEENILQQGYRHFYNLEYDEVFPLKTVTFREKDLVCINNPPAFFERYYGQDWKTPR
jgi:hypothetical protein